MSFGVNDESRARQTGAVSQGTWRVAAEHSRIDFKVRKMGLYFVKGRFKRLSGSVEVGPDGMPMGGTVRIDASSVTTRMPPRDWHLRTRDFLSVRRHPEITIRVDNVVTAINGAMAVAATVIVGDVTTPVRFSAHWHAPEHPSEGGPMLHVSGVVDRHELGVRPRRPVDWIIGREVHLEAHLRLAPAW
jgi:polyisoprenoid-binding protein YceI